MPSATRNTAADSSGTATIRPLAEADSPRSSPMYAPSAPSRIHAMKPASKCSRAASREGVWPERRRVAMPMRRTVGRQRPRRFRRAVGTSLPGGRIRTGKLGFLVTMARPRAQLDTAALARAFAADGLHGTPIDDVAETAGVAKPTLYARFGDKEELFALAVEAEVERLVARLDAAGGGDRLPPRRPALR